MSAIFKKILSVVCFGFVLAFSLFATMVHAETYSTQYPNVYNSGGPLWLECELEGLGRYVIVIDPNTNPQSFGFDGPHNSNLINNTADAIVGRAYDVNSNAGYGARWPSFYKLQLQTGTTVNGQRTFEDYDITAIYGTTLDLIDYNGTRGNDTVQYSTDTKLLCLLVVCGMFVGVGYLACKMWKA